MTKTFKIASLKPSKFSLGIYDDTPTPDLIDSIKRHCVLTPIWVSPSKEVISGHRRLRACKVLGLTTIPAEVKPYSPVLVIEANRYRTKTLTEKLKEAEALEVILKPQAKERMKGSSNLTNPVHTRKFIAQHTGISEGNLSKVKFIQTHAPDFIEQIDTGRHSIHSAYSNVSRKVRREDKIKVRLSEKFNAKHAPLILHGDFRDGMKALPAGSVDMVLCDPPYPKSYLPLWADLGREAARVLKPGGFLITYTSQFYLPEVMGGLGKHLDYYWLATLLFEKTQLARIYPKGMLNKGKPILFYVKPPVVKRRFLSVDVFSSDNTDKDFHEWGQSVEPFERLVREFSAAGDRVVIPFGGGGAEIEACLKVGGRRVTAFELDRKTWGLLKRRFGR